VKKFLNNRKVLHDLDSFDFNMIRILIENLHKLIFDLADYETNKRYIVILKWTEIILYDAYIIMMCTCGMLVPGFSYGVEKNIWNIGTWFMHIILYVDQKSK